ncbi:MAG: hypothetical protein Q7V62_10475, partial [Actinomycetota bacterium]|nr:hypothetical protein [Actinomycetota bacterium]
GVARTLLSVGGAEAEVTTTAHITAEGTTTIEFRSEDNLGHAETTHTATIRIDDSAPSVACAAAATYTDGAVLAISASDPYSGVASVAYRLDAGATQTVAAASAGVTTTVWGNHTLRYVATDALGNESDAQVASFRVVPSVVTPRVARSPSAWSKTVKRKRGVARYTLRITVTRPGGVPIGALGVRIQTSKNGRTGWKNAYWLRTNSSGVAYKAFSTKKRATRYYRWYLSSSYQSRALYTTKQRIIIR